MKVDMGVAIGEREKKMLAGLGSIVILFVGWQFVISPKYDDIQQFTTEVDQNKETRDTLKEQYDHLDQYKHDLKLNKMKLNNIKEVIPQNINNEDILDNVTNLWKQSKVKLTSGVTISDAAAYTPTNGTAVPGLFKRDVNVTISGGYNNILSFVKNVEGSRLKFSINNLGLSSDDKGALSANFAMSTYTFNPTNKLPDEKVIDTIPKFGDFNMFIAVNNAKAGVNAPNPAGTSISASSQLYSGLTNNGKQVIGTSASDGNTVFKGISTKETSNTNPTGATKINPGNASASSINMDFYAILKPDTNDAPALTMGKFPLSYSEIYSDLNDSEKLDLTITKQGGKLYYKYNTSNSSYPNVQEEFKPSGGKIIFHIISSSRVDSKDKAGINLTINNASGVEMDVLIVHDDEKSPRVKIVKTSGTVNVENQK